MGKWLPLSLTHSFYKCNPTRLPRALPSIFLVPEIEGFEYRATGLHNLLNRGIASVLPMIPYYRIPQTQDQDRWCVNSVADFLLQLTVGFMESLSLHRGYVRHRSPPGIYRI